MGSSSAPIPPVWNMTQIDNEGQGNFNTNRQQGGTIGGMNLNCGMQHGRKTGINDSGWVASLPYHLRPCVLWVERTRCGVSTFNATFRKTMKRHTGHPFLQSLRSTGLRWRVPLWSWSADPGNLKLIPYVLGNVTTNNLVNPASTKTNAQVGGDIKYSITQSYSGSYL